MLTTLLRVASLLAFLAPVALLATTRVRVRWPCTTTTRAHRAPLIANLAAFGLFVPSLLAGANTFGHSAPLLLAAGGFGVAAAGAALALRARMVLGRAWSLVPHAHDDAGLVTTGPFRRVRHPIYLGLSVHALGQALAWGSGPALLLLVIAIVPTFAWRAAAEERVLCATFGERYQHYQSCTGMLVPRLIPNARRTQSTTRAHTGRPGARRTP